MIALVAGLVLVLGAVTAAVWDLFRQTAAASARPGSRSAVSTPRPQPWTALDDVQVARLLQHPHSQPSRRRG